MKNKKFEKSLLFKIWDYFILFFILVSIVVLIYTYTHITPVQVRNFEKYNLIISFIFLIDLIVRTVVYGKDYIFSLNFIIDLLACSDIISPVLKSLRGVRYLRISRIVRLLRLFRIFRLLKVLKNIKIEETESKIITSVSIVVILIFIILSLIVSHFVNVKIQKIMYDNYAQYNSYLYAVSNQDKTFSEEQFNKEIKNRLILSHTNESGIDVGYYIFKESGKKLNIYSDTQIYDNFFEEDKFLFKTDKYEILFLNKKTKFYETMVEFIIILLSIPSVIIIIILLNYSSKKYIYQPIKFINDNIDRIIDSNFNEKIEVEFEETQLNQLVEKINKIISNKNPDVNNNGLQL